MAGGNGNIHEKSRQSHHSRAQRKNPKARYLVGWEAKFLVYSHAITPIWMMDWFASKIMILLGKFIKPK